MDDDVLQAAFCAHTSGATHYTRRMAITMAVMFHRTPRGVVRRLEELGLLRPGSWQWFVDNGGITLAQIRQVSAELEEGR